MSVPSLHILMTALKRPEIKLLHYVLSTVSDSSRVSFSTQENITTLLCLMFHFLHNESSLCCLENTARHAEPLFIEIFAFRKATSNKQKIKIYDSEK